MGTPSGFPATFAKENNFLTCLHVCFTGRGNHPKPRGQQKTYFNSVFLFIYLSTKVLHGPDFFLVVFEVLCGTCGGEILVLRQRNLSKWCVQTMFQISLSTGS